MAPCMTLPAAERAQARITSARIDMRNATPALPRDHDSVTAMGNVIRDHRGIDPRRLWPGLALVAGLVGCPRPQDPALKQIDVCLLRHSAGATQDPTNASDVCDGARLPDLSQLPAPLVEAGCTAMGTYQLGLGRKSL